MIGVKRGEIPGGQRFLRIGVVAIAMLPFVAACAPPAESIPTPTTLPSVRTMPTSEPTTVSQQTTTLEVGAVITPEAGTDGTILVEERATAQELGIRTDLERLHPNWPKTHEEAAILLAADSAHSIRPEQLVRIVDQDGIWRGWWMGETFPLKAGISYNQARGCHVDANGNPVFDPLAIFNTTQAPRPEDLANIRVNADFIAVFGRRGGATRDGLPQHTHYFTGEDGTEVSAIEQLSIIPVPEEVCVDWDLRSDTAAWRQAVKEFRDNPHARDGFVENGIRRFVNVIWFNAATRQWQQLDGRMIAELTRQHYDLSLIDRLPAGWPLSNEVVAKTIGGQPEHWVFDPSTGEWFYESWPFKAGIKFVPGVGHFSSDGRLLVGAKQMDARTSEIFDFNQPPADMANGMNGPGYLPAVLFVRVGRMTENPNLRDHSWWTLGAGDIITGESVIEQAALMPTGNPCLPTTGSSTEQLERARRLATEQSDPNVTASYWNGNDFVPAR